MKVLFSGRPTGPDVEAIAKRYPELKPGDTVLYSDVAEIIEEKENTTRFHTVISAYRRRMYRDRNVEMTPETGVGLTVKDNSQRVEGHSRKIAQAIRGARRAATGAQRTPIEGLSIDEKRTRDHTIIVGASFKIFSNRIETKIDWKAKEIREIADAVVISTEK